MWNVCSNWTSLHQHKMLKQTSTLKGKQESKLVKSSVSVMSEFLVNWWQMSDHIKNISPTSKEQTNAKRQNTGHYLNIRTLFKY